jgi:hypothetical protein
MPISKKKLARNKNLAMKYRGVATPLEAKCEGEAHTPKKWEVGVLRDS